MHFLKRLINNSFGKISLNARKLMRIDAQGLSESSLFEERTNPIINNVLTYIITFIVFVFIIWSSLFEVDEVAFANGFVVPQENVVDIQILEANTIKKIHVEEGELVEPGQKLLEFDESLLRRELESNIAKQQNQKKRLKYLNEQKNIRKQLFEKGLNSRISYLTIEGQYSELKGDILETEIKISYLQDSLEKLIITSPIKGYIHSVQKENPKDVIEPGTTIFNIVPYDQQLMAEVKISPDDIGQITEKQEVTLKFNTYDFSKYGGIVSKLESISPTTIPVPEGEAYYKGVVKIPLDAVRTKYEDIIKIIPGMTLIAEIKTGKKSIMKYLLGPITKSVDQAFKEK